MTSIDDIVTRLLRLSPKWTDYSLDRMWRILDALGHPERRLPPVIHVAGTNGKGSTIAFMRAILEAAGKRVHVYTSPHLVRFNERFRLGADREGAPVSNHKLAEAFKECERVNAGEPIFLFEITTAAGLTLFAGHPADILLMEVGVGGRLDATNIVEHPLSTVITPVSLDHTERLGNTVGKIATEKAGILKRGVPAVIATQPREALAAIEGQAALIGAPLRIAGNDWTATESCGRLVYKDDAGILELPTPKLYGRHQFENAGVAIAALRAVDGLKLAPAAFEIGIATADWPARMQRLSQGRLAAQVAPGGELWLDGAHNADGARAIADAMADLEEHAPRTLVLVVGMVASKDCEAFLKNLAHLARCVIAIPIFNQTKSLPAEAIVDAARAIGVPAQVSASIEEALAVIGRLSLDPPPRILITGSLHLAGEVLKANGTPPN